MLNVFIIGSKGIPAKYGGFETFVDNLVSNKTDDRIKYHVSCLADNKEEFTYSDARCFNVPTPDIGSAKAVLYDILSLKEVISYIRKNNLKNCIVYILACRIGPFFSYYKKKLEKLDVKVYVNPDGHEWKRSKWSGAVRKYWKISESLMVKNSDLLICDSKGIEGYIQKEYEKYTPATTFISYGADVTQESLTSDEESVLKQWYREHDIKSNNYFLIVGRFVPENNYELMIREYMQSSTNKDLVIISNVEENEFYKALLEKTNFNKDPRIKFVGTVYNQKILKKIREQAYGYIHGHEVGGTNPSLLEALASTNINLLLDVIFNVEVGAEGAVYFSKKVGSLAKLIDEVESFSTEKIIKLEKNAKARITNEYSWKKIVKSYEDLFINSLNK